LTLQKERANKYKDRPPAKPKSAIGKPKEVIKDAHKLGVMKVNTMSANGEVNRNGAEAVKNMENS
jgi:hypothetical protein